MPTFTAFQAALRKSLERSWFIAPDNVQQAKDIMVRFALLAQQKIPRPNVYRVLIDVIRQDIEAIVSSDRAPIEVSQHKALQQNLKTLTAPTDETKISTINSEMDTILQPTHIRWFKLELVGRILARLSIDIHAKCIEWADSFIQLSPDDAALLISQLCYEAIDHGWQIPYEANPSSLFSWIKGQAVLAERQDLFKLGESLSDNMALFAIPDTPQFCLKSDGSWCILDSETIELALASDESYRQTLAEIEDSGPTGIGYDAIFNEENDALNRVLIAWRTNFPIDEYNAADDEDERQTILGNHERWIDRADICLDLAVYRSLPEEIRQIPMLIAQFKRSKQLLEDTEKMKLELQATLTAQLELIAERNILMEKEDRSSDEEGRLEQIDDDLMRFDENIQFFEHQLQNGSSEDIRVEIQSVKAQLKGARRVREEINIEELKQKSFFQAQGDIICAVDEDDISSSILLNHDPESDACVLTEVQLSELVNHAVDDLIARNYKRKGELPGQFRKQLDACREKQEEYAFKCQGSLRTDQTNDEITRDRVRDFVDRRCYIDVATATNARDFRDVIIGGCLRSVDANSGLVLLENIQNFLAKQGGDYPEIAKKKFDQFRAGKLILASADQMKLLESYVLPARYDLLPTIGYFAAKSVSKQALDATATNTITQVGAISSSHV